MTSPRPVAILSRRCLATIRVRLMLLDVICWSSFFSLAPHFSLQCQCYYSAVQPKLCIHLDSHVHSAEQYSAEQNVFLFTSRVQIAFLPWGRKRRGRYWLGTVASAFIRGGVHAESRSSKGQVWPHAGEEALGAAAIRCNLQGCSHRRAVLIARITLQRLDQ